MCLSQSKGIIAKDKAAKDSTAKVKLLKLNSFSRVFFADFDASAKFYTYGFDWHPDRIRLWMIHPSSGKKIVL